MKASDGTTPRPARGAACGAALALVVLGAMMVAPRRARAQDEAPASNDRWQASLGLRGALFRDAGLDPFSANDAFVQTSMAVSAALRTGTGLVPALGFALDLGNADDTARGVDSHLGLSRIAVLLEPRWVPRSDLYLAGRLAPGLLRASTTLRDPSAPVLLRASYTSLSLDASLGAGMRLNSAAAPVGLWILAEGGYGWAPRHRIALTPALPQSDASKAGEVLLGTFAARGPFLRIGLALSY